MTAETDERRAGMQELTTQVAVLGESQKNNNRMTEELHTAMLGKDGMMSRVSVVEERSKSNRKTITWHTKVIYGLSGTGGIAVIVGVIIGLL